MARVMLTQLETRREFFVTEAPVGPGLTNREDDVRLVQFLLKVAMEDAGASRGFKPPREKVISVDGRYGRQTHAYVKFYQEEVNRRERKKFLEPDGRIDPPGSKFFGDISKTFYTIIDLNVAYRTRRGDGMRIETDGLFPKALMKSFFLGGK